MKQWAILYEEQNLKLWENNANINKHLHTSSNNRYNNRQFCRQINNISVRQIVHSAQCMIKSCQMHFGPEAVADRFGCALPSPIRVFRRAPRTLKYWPTTMLKTQMLNLNGPVSCGDWSCLLYYDWNAHTRFSVVFLFHWIINLNAVFKVRMQMATLGTHKPGIKTEHAQNVHVNDQYGIWMNMATVGNV